LIGEILGLKYKLVSLLGRGGMGAVYEAIHTETAARVAVKVLHEHLAEGEARRRFRREAGAVARIQDENIVRILDAGTCETTGHLYLVTERLEGEDLQHLLDRVGPLSLRGALCVAADVLRGLSKAHAAGVVHRDIKPGNIFVARGADGALAVKILDFGIAKVRAEPLALEQTTANLTATGHLLGSPLYMSPEQVQNSRDVDHRTDLWSLGCVLYAALSGRAPHQHLSSIGQLLVAICVTPSRPLVEVAPWVPAEIAAIVHRALELQPEARYPSAEAMLADLSRFVPPGAMVLEDLLASGDRRAGAISSLPPGASSSTPRFIVAPASERPIRGDEVTAYAGIVSDPFASFSGDTRLAEARGEVARSAVPKLAARVGGSRHITVDPRRLLGEKTELWTFSLDVHPHLSSLIARVWKALRRAGAKVPPMTYGTEWVLFEPRTGRFVADDVRQGAERSSLEAAGIRPGTVLWVMPPEGREREPD
jgi:eukaryotic-like serine/threonine-protein kinase